MGSKPRLPTEPNLWVRVRTAAQGLKSSLWLVPGASVLAAVGLANLLAHIDQLDVLDRDSAWFLFGGSADSAQELLSALATGIITLAGVVFSITVIVLQLASSQYSPRVLQTFLSDRKTQAAMGLFLGTFAYNIMLLTKVRVGDGGNDEFVPELGIFVGYVAVLLSVLTFVDYIHHMTHSIRAVTVIRRIADDTRQAIERRYSSQGPYEPDRSIDMPPDPPNRVVPHGLTEGVLAEVDTEALLKIACEHELIIALVPWPGDFVASEAPLAHVWGSSDFDVEKVQQAVSVEDERNAGVDLAYGFRQLVDIALRGLSSSINDPTTSVQVLDRLHDLLRRLVTRSMPPAVCIDDRKQVRVILPQPDWEAYVSLALDEIRHDGSNSMQVMRRMRALLMDLLAIAPDDRRAVLHDKLSMLDRDLERSA